MNGILQLRDSTKPRGHRLPIDFFFRSLALDLRGRALGIVLSGTGSDGTLCGRAIKGEGRMAQRPASTGFDSMPMTENALKKIFILLCAQTGHDFSQYKPSTIFRRIDRRMAVHQIALADEYIQFLQKTPEEVESLFRDLLIGVTNFFRDPESFKTLEEIVIPKIFADKPADGTIRVWSTGCSTGEEAYSIAILLQERLEVLKSGIKIRIFVTDIDSRAIATARAGVYPASIAADVSPQRLTRFFTAEADAGAYRIQKSIRDMLVFSEHNVIKNPPFSKLDLISCRNLLIYMGAELQKKLIPLFYYALNPDGILFLGSSETVAEFNDLFAAVDRKAKLYQRKPDFQGAHRHALGRLLPPMLTMDTSLLRPSTRTGPLKLPLRELTEQSLLQQIAPAGALVNAQGDILYLHGRTGMYLELVPGETAINNILKMARDGLRRDLTTALHKAAGTREIVRVLGMRVKTNGHYSTVNLSVRPVAPSAASPSDSPLFLVILQEPPSDQEAAPQDLWLAADGSHVPGSDADAHIAALKQELRAKEEYLQSTNEELETSNEELKFTNEGMQSVNEELQSTNEELESSKEELQSVNEELATVNTELQTKVADLSQANNDMNNLMAGAGIATVFIDHHMRILRFTPATTRIINLILSDVGRPVAHVVTNLVDYNRLVADTQLVLDTLMPKEVSVQTTKGTWYTMRILPYRTLDNVVEGAVITFVDITELKRIEEALQKAANELTRLAVVVRDAHDAITVQDLNGQILAWNPGAYRLYGWNEAEALLMNVRDRIPPKLREEALNTVHQLSRAEILKPYLTQRITKAGALVEVSMTSTALINEFGQIYAIATTERTRESKTPEPMNEKHG